VRGFNTLFSGTGKVFQDEGNALDRKNFSGGYALYAFDLTSDLGKDDHFSLDKQGSVRLVLKFAQPLADPVTVIAYAEFQNVIEIDRNRNVIYDFAVWIPTSWIVPFISTRNDSTVCSAAIVYRRNRG